MASPADPDALLRTADDDEDDDMAASDSEYAYEDDDDDDDAFLSDSASDADQYTADRPGLTPLCAVRVDLPRDTPQYRWTVLCLRLAATYAECAYDRAHSPLCVRFLVADRELHLTVDAAAEPSLEYPNAPPHVAWAGAAIAADQRLLLTANRLLQPAAWNLCADLNAFVCRALDVMRHADAADPQLERLDATLGRIVQTCGAAFRFEDEGEEDLPSLGVMTTASAKRQNGYLGSGEATAKAGSLAELLREDIKEVVLALDRHPLPPSYAKVLHTIVAHVLNAEISKLEAVQNEQYYRHLIQIVEKADLALDVDWMRTLLEPTPGTTALKTLETTNDKVFFVEAFANHAFALRAGHGAVTGKLIKRVYAELESLGDAVKDIECYVAVSESDIRLMKMLMIPDYDTPYGGGYFEFDVMVPTDYPNVPPKVQFLTTGGGKVRFNPNLYNCGKVCLSVLNTWAENQWSPASSTLAQVTLSIFSMVFIDHPYTNEPAFYDALATAAGKTQSESYNKRVRRDCARVAISGQLTNTATPFANIIQRHWRMHAKATIDHYAKHEIGIQAKPPSSSKRSRGKSTGKEE